MTEQAVSVDVGTGTFTGAGVSATRNIVYVALDYTDSATTIFDTIEVNGVSEN